MRHLILASFILALAGNTSWSQSHAPEGPTSVKWPDKLWGSIVDKHNKPIPDATVKLELQKIHEFEQGRWDEVIHTFVATTNAEGRFEIDATKFPALDHRPFCIMLYISADGFSDGKSWAWYGPDSIVEGPKLWTSKLLPGKVMVGRCVDPDGNSIEGAVVRAYSGYFSARPRVHVGWDTITSSPAGFFTLKVPNDGKHKINLWIAHPDWTAEFVDLKLDAERPFKVQMKRGGAVKGHVHDIDGDPLEGIVVSARSHNDGNIPILSVPMNIASKTNADGFYELPPLHGKYVISLCQAARSVLGSESGFFAADQPPPLVAPKLVDLAPGKDEVLDFQESPLVKIRGTIRWPDGSPASGGKLQMIYFPVEVESGGPGTVLAKVTTNEDGTYKALMPMGIPGLIINASQVQNEQGKWLWPHPQKHALTKRTNTSYHTLNAITEDIDGIDWVLKDTHD